MKQDIYKKIEKEFKGGITEESQLVYILTKIRKIIEIEARKDFPYLKLYSNWALHAKIDDTNLIKDLILSDKDEDSVKQIPIQTHEYFFGELNKFIGNSCNYKLKREDIIKITELLNMTFQDTPLIITKREKYEYVVKSDGSGNYYSFFKRI